MLSLLSLHQPMIVVVCKWDVDHHEFGHHHFRARLIAKCNIQAPTPEMGDRVTSELHQRRSHRSEMVSQELKFLKSVKLEEIKRATYVDHDLIHLGINHPHEDHQGIIIV